MFVFFQWQVGKAIGGNISLKNKLSAKLSISISKPKNKNGLQMWWLYMFSNREK